MVHMMVNNDDTMMDLLDGKNGSAYDGAYDGEK